MSDLKNIKIIAKSNPAQVGDGFFIRRPMPSGAVRLGEMSPFLMLDHAGPTIFEPSNRPKGVDEHPHRGFETVTIVYQGELEHRDSNGGQGKIGAGDVQWMTAASGVVHEEKHSQAFTEQGGTLEIIQLWVNLPSKYKMITPRYQEILASSIPEVKLNEAGNYVRVIAGEYEEEKGAADTYSTLSLLDFRIKKAENIDMSTKEGDNLALYVLKGAVEFADGQVANEGEIVIFEQAGEQVNFKADDDTKVLLMTGEPLNEPIASYGPFVMNSAEEIQQAISDFRTGKMGSLQATFG